MKNAKDELEYSGTAFAVSNTRVVTCFHNIGDSDLDGKQPIRDCILVTSIVPSEQPIPIQFVDGDSKENQDWAIYERTDGSNFPSFLPICPEENLPEVSSDIQLTQYFAPIGLFTSGSLGELKIWADKTHVLQYQLNDTQLVLAGGLYSGSCGSPAVTLDGYAVCMQVYSINELHEYKGEKFTARVKPLTKRSLSDVQLGLDQIEDFVGKMSDDISNHSNQMAHASVRSEIVLCKIPSLMSLI
jgi:hypothetical protein